MVRVLTHGGPGALCRARDPLCTRDFALAAAARTLIWTFLATAHGVSIGYRPATAGSTRLVDVDCEDMS